MSWKTFLKAHWDAIAAADFFSVEVLTATGLVRHFVLFTINLRSRRVQVARISHNPDEWRRSVANSLTQRAASSSRPAT
jgi:hypothetical protein